MKIQNNDSHPENARPEIKPGSVLSRIDGHDGLTVPEGFFDSFAERMEQQLPATFKPEATVMPKTFWQRVRPYVYMAAMFGGIWCMLKMFTIMSPANIDLSIDNNHVLTEALGDYNFVVDQYLQDFDDSDIYDQMYEDSIGIDQMMEVDENLETVSQPLTNE